LLGGAEAMKSEGKIMSKLVQSESWDVVEDREGAMLAALSSEELDEISGGCGGLCVLGAVALGTLIGVGFAYINTH